MEEYEVDFSMCYICKEQNGAEYFLRDCKDGKILWTRQIARAYDFGTYVEINEFVEKYLPGRTDYTVTRR